MICSWDGTDGFGNSVAAAYYTYRILVGNDCNPIDYNADGETGTVFVYSRNTGENGGVSLGALGGEKNSKGEIAVIPNPASSEVTFMCDSSTETVGALNVFSAQGHKIAQVTQNQILKKGRNKVSWDCSHLSEGLYIYELVTKDETLKGRFIKLK